MMDFLCQIDTKLLIGGIGIVITVTIGAYGYIFRHATNSEKHHKIDTDKIVFKDVCDKNHELVKVKLENIKETVDEKHKDTKEQLDRIEKLIRGNGKLHGAIT